MVAIGKLRGRRVVPCVESMRAGPRLLNLRKLAPSPLSGCHEQKFSFQKFFLQIFSRYNFGLIMAFWVEAPLGFSVLLPGPCDTIGRYVYLFKRLMAVLAGRFYRFEHICHIVRAKFVGKVRARR